MFYVSTILAENLKYESWKNIFVPAVYINQNNWKDLGKDSSQVANSVLVNDSLVGFLNIVKIQTILRFEFRYCKFINVHRIPIFREFRVEVGSHFGWSIGN